MKLVDYIREGYNIVTSRRCAKEIRNAFPEVRVFTDNAFDAIPCEKLLVDQYYAYHSAVLSAKPCQKAFAIEMFTHEFFGAETVLPVTGEGGRVMDVGLSMKQLRQKLGMTQEELSELSGVSRVSIGNYERGDREPTVSIAIAIAEALGVTLEELVCVIHEKFDKLPKGSHVLSKEQTDKLFFNKPNLLEIKLKDTDSVPEVYYKGERLDELPKAIEYYSTSNDKYLDKKIIGHKRDM